MTVTPMLVRQARTYLQMQHVRTSDISPRHFAAVSDETGKSFKETLRFIALLLSGGAGNGPSPESTADQDRLDPVQALGDQGKPNLLQGASA